MPAERRIYAVFGVPPEVQAYAMAKYSRSSQSMLESIRELSQQKAEQFLNTFYFQYGHRSIADMAHLVLALENISFLAAMRVVDEQLWDGQERSTRYQDFLQSGYYVPEALQGGDRESFCRAAEQLFGAYHQLLPSLIEAVRAIVPRPQAMAEGAYHRAVRARALDVARYLLPLATYTSVGQVVSARVLERQISRLLSDSYPEVRAIGEELRSACQRPAEIPLLEGVCAADGLLHARAAPTLVKYARESDYLRQSRQALEQASRCWLSTAGAADRSEEVSLADEESVSDELVASLLYTYDAAGHSYRQVQAVVRQMSDAQRREVIELAVRPRGRHDELLRPFQTGYGFKFDVLMDLGSFRDLHRHRRCVQLVQPLTWEHGHEPAEEVLRSGLGELVAEAAKASRLDQVYEATIAEARQTARHLAESGHDDNVHHYLLPLAHRCRALFKMDLAQVVYIAELRTAPAGHFSYRRVAWKMWQAVVKRYPSLAGAIEARVGYPFQTEQDLLAR